MHDLAEHKLSPNQRTQHMNSRRAFKEAAGDLVCLSFLCLYIDLSEVVGKIQTEDLRLILFNHRIKQPQPHRVSATGTDPALKATSMSTSMSTTHYFHSIFQSSLLRWSLGIYKAFDGVVHKMPPQTEDELISESLQLTASAEIQTRALLERNASTSLAARLIKSLKSQDSTTSLQCPYNTQLYLDQIACIKLIV